MKIYRMGAYCRLSKEDAERKGASESIENQLKVIEDYVSRNKDLELGEVYADDGYSGLHFSNRPQFARMMEDIYRGRIQGVITKDISRLGREHIETGNYIERVFPSMNIRFISVLDGIDSLTCGNEEMAQFKTLLNDMYSRDISRKIKGALTAQKKLGMYMSGFAPYGYVKDPSDRHRFVVDEAAAETVREIFRLYLEGFSKREIAAILNERGVLPPALYKRKVLGLNYSNARESPKWSYPSVDVILKNRAYIGDMVQHKTEKISYKLEKCRQIPEQDRYVVEGTHEPIIDRATFDKAQSDRRKKPASMAQRRE